METAQKQDPNSSEDVDMKWSPVAVVIKIKPPKNPPGPLDGPLEMFRKTDWFSRLSAQEVDRDAENTKEKNVEPVPDVLWPNAKTILCSAVSRCSRFVALGLEGALVCVWDRRSGEHIPHPTFWDYR
ncbi:hypothetical protein EYF80_062739 [Liparis tanakae]|uniref:Uncharacterized protein n=1 Tax=Liparis tanakae TaxID=230148 RepID=A0A4Z2EEB9_9TELE|nr:hypothetical protein EYF80_062739 [Liparis tanakae]